MSSANQETIDGKLTESAPVVIVLVVDDAASADAASLRAEMVKSVRAGLLSEIAQSWGSCGSPDPAMWHPENIRLVIVRPSAPDNEALVTPVQLPSLAWISNASLEAEVEAVAAGAADALEQRLAAQGEPFRPLAAAKRAVDLMTGARAPENDTETALVASLPKERDTWLVIAATRDDEDPSPVESLALDSASTELVGRKWMIGPFTATSGCIGVSNDNTRLQAWGKQASAELGAVPCNDAGFWDDVLTFCCADCAPECHAKPIAVSPEGIADCRIYVDQTDLTQCDAKLGLQDPDGKTELVDRSGQQLRRCEVIPLQGADLEACRTSLECSGCASGWCVTEVPELSSQVPCGPNEYVWPLRFIGGPLSALGSYIYGVCKTK